LAPSHVRRTGTCENLCHRVCALIATIWRLRQDHLVSVICGSVPRFPYKNCSFRFVEFGRRKPGMFLESSSVDSRVRPVDPSPGTPKQVPIRALPGYTWENVQPVPPTRLLPGVPDPGPQQTRTAKETSFGGLQQPCPCILAHPCADKQTHCLGSHTQVLKILLATAPGRYA